MEWKVEEWKDSRHIIRYLKNIEREEKNLPITIKNSMKENRPLGRRVNCKLEENGSWGKKSVLLMTAKRFRKISTKKRSSDLKWKKYPDVLFLRTVSVG